MSDPGVTVLMPIRDYHPAYLDEAIGSIESQTSPAWRLLLVLSPPADRRRLRDQLGERLDDPRVAVVANEGRQLAGALNTGMRHTTTDFAAILFADDLWEPDSVAVLGRYISSFPEADFFHSSRRFVDEDGAPISSVYPSRRSVRLADFEQASPVKHLLCWRVAKAMSFGGMDESLNSVGPDDYDFPWTMAEHGARFVAVSECLYVARDHRDCFRLTTHLPLSHHKRELRRILKKHGASRAAIKRRIERAEQSYLRQCIYTSRLDKWLKELRGYDPRQGERALYR